MSQLSKDEVGHNLIKIFSKDISTKTYFPRWCELGSFLTQKVKVLHAMDKLDNLMFEKLCNRKAIKPGIVAKNRKMVEDAYSAFYKGPQTLLCELVKKDVTHLLSDILTENEEKFLFETTPGETQQKSVIAVNPTKEVDTRKHVPTYYGFVKAENFNSQLSKKTNWKDPGADIIHGEYTHRLQWFAVTCELWTTGATASNVFAAIGKYPGSYNSTTSNGNLHLWDALCDRTNGQDVFFSDADFLTSDGKGRGEDFRSPENLNMFLIEKNGFQDLRWPLLQIFLKARYKKRAEQFKNSNDFMLKQQETNPDFKNDMVYFQFTYLSEKLYGKSFNDADDKQRKVILELIGGKDSDQIWKF